MNTEWRAPHVTGCQVQPLDDQQPVAFCIGCAFEREADSQAFAAFLRLVGRWFQQSGWGRG